MNKILCFITIIVVICSCSPDSKNREMIEFVRSQEHDSRLVGWWESVHVPEEFFYYDGNTFELLSLIRETDGSYSEFGHGAYWYTKDGELYFMKKASVFTGIMSANVGYRISDDLEYLLMKEPDGTFDPSCRRIAEAPEGYNPRK